MSLAYRIEPVITKEQVNQIDAAIMAARQYFAVEYHAGTREMVWRYVTRQIGDVNHNIISVALRVLKDNGEIVWDKHVWWRLVIR